MTIRQLLLDLDSSIVVHIRGYGIEKPIRASACRLLYAKYDKETEYIDKILDRTVLTWTVKRNEIYVTLGMFS